MPPWITAARLSGLAALSLSLAPGRAAAAADAWVQLGAGGASEVRVLVGEAQACPPLRVDGDARPMSVRAGAEAGFPSTVCTAPLPAGARRIEAAGVRLAAPPRSPKRILVIGDSGCRMKGATIQACNDPRAWPFATVARLAAARRPDLVIHVGDYHYRESACPAGEAACSGSPYGDREAAWRADLLDPARPLLRAAPWVFVRGNHESCARAGRGWSRMLAQGATPCQGVEPPYVVTLDGLDLAVIDSAEADDRLPSPQQVAAVGAQLDALAPVLAKPAGEAWLLTHRPIWGLVPALKLGPLGVVDVAVNATEQAAVRGRDLSGVAMTVSGHIHHFATYDFGGARPAQLVVGTGGDIGEKADSPRARAGSVTLDGLPADRYTFYRFGYLLLERSGTGWAGAFHDVSDRVAATCRLQARALTCRSVRPPGAR